MTLGRRLFFIGLSLLAVRSARAEDSADFKAVCEALRATAFVQADFQEEKTLHMLARPLQSQGTLMFSPQRGVYRITKEPFHQEMLITRKRLVTKNDQGVVERMSVNRQPAARGFVDVFLSFFSGDERAWRKLFTVSFSGSRQAWTLEFIPLPKTPMAKAIQRIVLEGQEGLLNAMTLIEVNGDQTRTLYQNARVLEGAQANEALQKFPQDL